MTTPDSQPLKGTRRSIFLWDDGPKVPLNLRDSSLKIACRCGYHGPAQIVDRQTARGSLLYRCPRCFRLAVLCRKATPAEREQARVRREIAQTVIA